MQDPRPTDVRHRLLALLSEVLIFAGLALVGYSAWTLWGTGLQTADAQQAHQDSLRETWQEPTAGPAGPTPTAEPDGREGDPEGERRTERELGDALALIRIPALGADWEWAVLEGTDYETLTEGIGHLPESAAPGAVGNFVVAGHRATYGEPFARVPDDVGEGDRIEVETRDAVFTYRVTRTKHTTPYDAAVMAPVPEEPGVRPKQEAITLITCTPRWGSTGRWIVFGELVDSVRKPADRGE